MKNLASLLIVASFLAGCASNVTGVKNDFVVKENSRTGLLVISTRLIDNRECIKPATLLQLSYSNSKDGKEFRSGHLQVRNVFLKKDFENPDGYFHVQEVEEGDYDIGHLSYGSGLDPAVFREGHFRITANQANYLGEVTITVNRCGTFARGDNTLATLVFEDQSKRDTARFHERVPGVKLPLVYQKIGTGTLSSIDLSKGL